MADLRKFLDQAGVSTLWSRITDKVTTAVNAEAERAQAAEQANAAAAAAASNAAAKAQQDVNALSEDVGSVDNLSTTNKTVVNAINEVLAAVGTGGTAAVVTMTTDTTTEGALKSYTLKQGTTTIGTIDIPKDMVVESGSVVTNPEGQAEGTYIKLVLANVAEPLYINVGTLVDIYKAAENATQIQLAIDSSTREISATIVAGSITTTELADNAVTTVKIADANVTLAKLSAAVQASLAKADSAVQSVTEGTANGTINVDGTDVSVHGLGTAAYKNEEDFDTAGAAQAVDNKLTEEIARAKAAEEKALSDAKAYTDRTIEDLNLAESYVETVEVKNEAFGSDTETSDVFYVDGTAIWAVRALTADEINAACQ